MRRILAAFAGLALLLGCQAASALVIGQPDTAVCPTAAITGATWSFPGVKTFTYFQVGGAVATGPIAKLPTKIFPDESVTVVNTAGVNSQTQYWFCDSGQALYLGLFYGPVNPELLLVYDSFYWDQGLKALAGGVSQTWQNDEIQYSIDSSQAPPVTHPSSSYNFENTVSTSTSAPGQLPAPNGLVYVQNTCKAGSSNFPYGWPSPNVLITGSLDSTYRAPVLTPAAGDSAIDPYIDPWADDWDGGLSMPTGSMLVSYKDSYQVVDPTQRPVLNLTVTITYSDTRLTATSGAVSFSSTYSNLQTGTNAVVNITATYTVAASGAYIFAKNPNMSPGLTATYQQYIRTNLVGLTPVSPCLDPDQFLNPGRATAISIAQQALSAK